MSQQSADSTPTTPLQAHAKTQRRNGNSLASQEVVIELLNARIAYQLVKFRCKSATP